MKSKIFLVGDVGEDFDLEGAPKLEVDAADFTPDSEMPDGMPELAFKSLVRLTGLIEAVEKYVEVSATYYFILGSFPQILYVDDPRRVDGEEGDVELPVDSSLLLASLLLTCAPCTAVQCTFIPTKNLSVCDRLLDSKTGAQVSEVRYLPGDGSTDCTRAVYLLKRELERGEVELIGSYNIETGKFEDLEGKELEVDENVAKFTNRENWMRDEEDLADVDHHNENSSDVGAKQTEETKGGASESGDSGCDVQEG